jgi:hypothetical protein
MHEIHDKILKSLQWSYFVFFSTGLGRSPCTRAHWPPSARVGSTLTSSSQRSETMECSASASTGTDEDTHTVKKKVSDFPVPQPGCH